VKKSVRAQSLTITVPGPKDRLMFGWEHNLRLVRVDDRPIYCVVCIVLLAGVTAGHCWTTRPTCSAIMSTWQLALQVPGTWMFSASFKLNLSSRSTIQQQRHGFDLPLEHKIVDTRRSRLLPCLIQEVRCMFQKIKFSLEGCAEVECTSSVFPLYFTCLVPT
jgi:hypothetical protein